MLFSLNESKKPTSINEMFFSEGLVMFDKEMKVFFNEITEGENTRT